MQKTSLLNLLLISILFFEVFSEKPSCDDAIKRFGTRYTCVKGKTENLGEGASGVAYLVNDSEANVNRVFKISNIRKRPVDESPMYVLHNKVNRSKYIIERFKVDYDKSFTYEILEYAEKGSLYTYSKAFNYSRDQKRILELFEMILKGIKTLHDNDIVHADIKPDNIVMTAEDEPRIIDFDISIAANTLGRSRGSPQFIAPEVVDNFGVGDMVLKPSIDIWSLGVTLYTMIYHRYPFIVEINNNRIKGSYDIINFYERTSNEIINLILMMLKKEPEKRSSIDGVLEKVHEILNMQEWTYLKDNITLLTSAADVRAVGSVPSKEKQDEIVRSKLDKSEDKAKNLKNESKHDQDVNYNNIKLIAGVSMISFASILIICMIFTEKKRVQTTATSN